MLDIKRSIITLVIFISVFLSASANAEEFTAGPADYKGIVSILQPGDILHLEAGTYPDLLNVTNLNGTPTQWITITGPQTGDPAIFIADPGPCCNTVEIRNSSYVAIKNITVDGNGVGGAFGISAKDGTSNLVHHILIEGCILINHDNGQQTVAISTKTPTWGWIIRNNQIIGAGTGLYLGNSDGTSPFIGGIIENNLVVDPLGYCMEIKWQQPRPTVDGMPQTPSSTIIRHNVFIKSDRVSPSGDRPNLLVGGFPESGAGSEDLYEIYGNFFFHNPRESHLQASGRVSIHDNIFVDVTGSAIRLQNHDLPLRMANVYNNTIYSAGTGISVGGTMDQGVSVVGNLLFANTGLSGTPTLEMDNIIDTVDVASNYLVNPNLELGSMELYPLVGECQGPAMDLSSFSAESNYNLDFNGADKGSFTFRGAYGGEGENSGWQLDEGIKNVSTASGECGDGIIDANEACDDGNTDDNDGCDSQCSIENGYSCMGTPSICTEISVDCGNGEINTNEECDDGNNSSNDGCNAGCIVEAGYSCFGQPSVCTQDNPPQCGNGIVEENEECDDGNTDSDDGCSSTCTNESSDSSDPGCSCTTLGHSNNKSNGLLLLISIIFGIAVIRKLRD
jgi:cysteine-rich repeat protein